MLPFCFIPTENSRKPFLKTFVLRWYKMEALARNSLNQSEAVVRRCSVKNVFLEISQNSQEKTCARVFFLNKVAGLLFNYF